MSVIHILKYPIKNKNKVDNRFRKNNNVRVDRNKPTMRTVDFLNMMPNFPCL